jgi:hypothetical protein
MVIFNFLFHVMDVIQKAKRSNTTKPSILSFFCHVIAVFLQLQHFAKFDIRLLILAPIICRDKEPMWQLSVRSLILTALILVSTPPSSSNTTTLNLIKSPTATWCLQISWLSQARPLSALAKPKISPSRPILLLIVVDNL